MDVNGVFPSVRCVVLPSIVTETKRELVTGNLWTIFAQAVLEVIFGSWTKEYCGSHTIQRARRDPRYRGPAYGDS